MSSKTDGPIKCTWDPRKFQESPHKTIPFNPVPPKILDNILGHIGNTPLVRINSITKSLGIECEVLAKCEFFNAGGSIKDRIGKRMIEDAEKAGRIKPGDTLIEPTSGNTGIGISLAAALKGYRMIITLPEKMSQEKVDVLKGLGSEIIRTPTEAAYDSPESHIGVAKRLEKEIINSHILDQYGNPSNPLAHYDGTAEELLYQTDGKIDVCVISAGTGGTLTGVARKLREKLPNIKIVGVDPVGSILAQPDQLNGEITSYKVEGIGYDFIPTVLDRSMVTEWVKTSDKESFVMARRMIREEGLLCGGSSGSAMVAALKVAQKMKKGQRVVVILPDSVRNYMSKHLNDDWMITNNFYEPEETDHVEWWSNKVVADLKLRVPLTVGPDVTCSECLQLLNERGYDQLPVIGPANDILGMVTMGNLSSLVLSGRAKANDPIKKVLYKQFQKVTPNTPLWQLSNAFNKDHFVLVVNQQQTYVSPNEMREVTLVFGVVTRIDLVHFIVGDKRPSAIPSRL